MSTYFCCAFSITHIKDAMRSQQFYVCLQKKRKRKSQINSSVTNVNREHYFASHFDVLYLLYVTMHFYTLLQKAVSSNLGRQRVQWGLLTADFVWLECLFESVTIWQCARPNWPLGETLRGLASWLACSVRASVKNCYQSRKSWTATVTQKLIFHPFTTHPPCWCSLWWHFLIRVATLRLHRWKALHPCGSHGRQKTNNVSKCPEDSGYYG